jgi:uncharacterized protein (TIGR02265 family)
MLELPEPLGVVLEHCDLTERLSLVPPSAQVRGLYFRSIEQTLERAGHLPQYRAIFPRRYSALQWQPAGEFLQRLVVGGALVASPDRVHEGMYEIGRRNAVAFAESLIGRMMLRLLSRDPRKLLQQAVAGRRQSYSYGSWQLSFPSQNEALMEMVEEYLYIESYMLGAAVGTFDAVGISVKAEATLQTPFNGRHRLTW